MTSISRPRLALSFLGATGTVTGSKYLLDCDDAQPSNVVYVFSEVLRPELTGTVDNSIDAIAIACSHEAGHSFGLGHTAEIRDVMLREPAEKSGVAALTGSLLDEGTDKHTGKEIAALVEDTGGTLNLGVSGGSFKVLTPDADLALGLLFECLSRPTFPADAFAILDEGAGKSHDPICIDALRRAIARMELMKAA